ncbi:MAG: hypothetical protein ACJ79R_18420, partial [Anaeromyxobacteraceae bacterium]
MNQTLFAAFLLAASGVYAAEPVLKPFVLAAHGPGEVKEVADGVKAKLAATGFEIVGAYQPYPDAIVLAVTSDELKELASRSAFGGYAAAQRVTVTKVGDDVQVAHTNPTYMAAAYRMASDLAPVAAALESALGRLEEYGPSEGKTAKDLRSYHYMFGMQHFDEPSRFGKFSSH